MDRGNLVRRCGQVDRDAVEEALGEVFLSGGDGFLTAVLDEAFQQPDYAVGAAPQAQLPVVLVVNKVDRPDARIESSRSSTMPVSGFAPPTKSELVWYVRGE
ncbi:MAG: hypothetical protein ACRDTF_04400 [Pseudonocardiaceae bacterium]